MLGFVFKANAFHLQVQINPIEIFIWTRFKCIVCVLTQIIKFKIQRVPNLIKITTKSSDLREWIKGSNFYEIDMYKD